MAQLMLLNPAKRPSKRRRKASPAQLAALARGRASRARLATNPRKRRKPMRAASSPVKRRRVRRNPINIGGIGIVGQVMNAGIGAAGALAVDAAVTYIPLPDMLKTGMMKHVTKAALALSVGLVGRRFIGRTAGKMAEGALTVVAYTAAKEMLAGAGMNLGYISPAQQFYPGQVPALSAPGMAEYINNFQNSGMGEYVSSGYGNGY